FSVLSTQPSDANPNDILSSSFILPGLTEFNRANYWGNNSSDAFLSNPAPIAGGELLMDASKFTNPSGHQLGSSARNEFRGPGFWNVDFSLIRGFVLPRLGERPSLQFRIDFFNVFNHTNLNNPAVLLGAAAFGTASFGRSGIGSSTPGAAPLN